MCPKTDGFMRKLMIFYSYYLKIILILLKYNSTFQSLLLFPVYSRKQWIYDDLFIYFKIGASFSRQPVSTISIAMILNFFNTFSTCSIGYLCIITLLTITKNVNKTYAISHNSICYYLSWIVWIYTILLDTQTLKYKRDTF